MSFTDRDKLIALAIVHIFETGKPLGDYSAVAVLNDGAGISYGINQFTHRSGSLYWVLDRYAKLGGELTHAIGQVMHDLASKSKIQSVSANATVKSDLRRLGSDPLMRQAQREIAFEKYLGPAIQACEGSDFVLPLSLAVIYDSINHGSFEKIRDRVVVERPGNGSMKEIEFEKEWISRYVRKRDAWLESVPRLKATDYRTDFFLAQIARGNWNLDLPLNVHGFRLTAEILDGLERQTFANLREDEIVLDLEEADRSVRVPQDPAAEPQRKPQDDPPADLPSETGEHVEAAGNQQAEAPPSQLAENILNVGDKNVPDNFTPDNKTLVAPEPSGILNRGWKWTAGLGLLPTSFAGLVETVKNYSADGNFNMADALRASKDVFIFLLPYLFWVGLAFVVFWGLKELLKQVSFMITQYTLARGDMHNVKVVPAVPEPGGWRFANLVPGRKAPLSVTAEEER